MQLHEHRKQRGTSFAANPGAVFSGGVKSFCALLLLLCLAACGGGKLGKLKAVEPIGTPFQRALAKEYRAFASAEDEKYQAYDAQYFADKGLRAAYGQETGPERLSRWDVKDRSKPALNQARNDMLDLFMTGITRTEPKKSAKMQVFFDCWVEQEEQGIDPYDLSCRDGFYPLLDELTGKQQKKFALYTGAPDEENCAQGTDCGENAPAAPQPGEPPGYTVFFAFDSAVLSAEAAGVIQGIANDIRGLKGYEVAVNGHADRAGTESYNLKLSKKRAEAVKERLISNGVPPGKILIFAFGESSPREPTANGVKNAANRRVEISAKSR